jgi:NAD(P)H-hydrate epimerase
MTCDLVFSAAQCRAIDEAAIRAGVPGLVLMENAGRGVADAIARARGGGVDGCDVRVLCGAGQNGGDGLVVARHLATRGARVRVILLAEEAHLRGDAAVNLTAARGVTGLAHLAVESLGRAEDLAADDLALDRWAERLRGADVIVDAIFGTGLRSDVKGVAAAAIAAVNTSPALRVAIDLPSGLDADTGRPRGVAVAADLTVTMAARKLGLVLDPEAPVGRLEIVDLGAPVDEAAAAAVGPLARWLTPETVAPLVPRSRASAHKGTRGHVLVIAGSAGKTGAAVLCGRAALRAGAGLVTLASTAAGQVALDAKVVELMTASYAAGDDADAQSWEQLAPMTARVQAVALGPGIPTGPGMRGLVQRLAVELQQPLVLDADALRALGPEAPQVLARAAGPRVLTPHPGELAALLGARVSELQLDRLAAARGLAASTGATVVSKGARTIVAVPDGTAYINPAATPALATAGSGDVLTGVIAGLLAQGASAAHAARVGVYAHGVAAEIAAATLGTHRLVAGDLPEAVARALETELAASIVGRDGERRFR